MMTDPIADMLTRIRNSVRVERPFVDIPASGVKKGIADVLKREGFIWDWKEVEEQPVAQIRIELKYGPNGERVIRIISTSKGVISDREARRDNVGGEVICEVA
jgi:small subunit ribosomal protein S8